MYPRNSLHENPGQQGRLEAVRGLFGHRSEVRLWVVWWSFGNRWGVVQESFGIVRGLFGGPSEVVRGSFEIFRTTKRKFFQFCVQKMLTTRSANY